MDETIHLPNDFIMLLEKAVGISDSKEIINLVSRPTPVTSIRVNPDKPVTPISKNLIPWCSTGLYLDQRPSFTLDPNFHAGAYYVQEPSSMFLEQFIKAHVPNSPIRALDLSAAPGGKSTHLLSLLNKNSLLVSNEVIRSRALVLSENIQKWGNANVVVTQNDPSHFTNIKGYFDLIVADAPCSGEGLFRKDPVAIQKWSMNNVQLCAQRQRRILSDIFPALAHHGILIYCTCTYNAIENEENMKWLATQHDIEFLKIPDATSWGVQEVNESGTIGYRLLPHRLKGEGFFICGIRKLGQERPVTMKHKHENLKSKPVKQVSELLSNISEYQFLDSDGNIKLFPEKWVNDLSLFNNLNCVQTGVLAGSYKREKFIPHHSLAISIALDKRKVWSIDLGKEDALRYLRKEQLSLNGIPNGYALVTFNGLGLGWINQLQSRSNNQYPTHWRIRMKDVSPL